ncbi:MAG TPA: CheR family methyltransferase [Terriglobales bacterium]|jgi:two-component system CheB/CheR fusion protein|nr:CheR family methyltransferase [Terriglobales bacterium]
MAKELTLKDLLQELAEQRNFDFRGYKKTTLERRFRRRMFQLNLADYAQYGDYIRKHPDEINQLLNTILINVTEFFRDPPAWEILRNEIMPSLLKRIKPGHSFRAWSAGCASGEEPYSIAILMAEHFGPRIQDYDVKIYATDIDDDALNSARRGEYSLDAVRRVRPEWREKYFHGKGMLRVNREIRRLVIFGRSNLGQDAPISHVNLLVCRNVLIYFDSDLQKTILTRLHYALEPGGILFLGKSESQLTNSPQFQRINARWRIFQRITASPLAEDRSDARQNPIDAPANGGRNVELDGLRQHHRYLMETLRIGVFSLSMEDIITQHNTAALILCGLAPANLTGKRLSDTDLFIRIPEIGGQLQATRVNNESSRFPTRMKTGNEEKLLEITIRPLLDERGQRCGTLIYLDDQTVQEKLQTTIEELESTSEELQSANEELETTNEELQSTNEELETTNEELQSTNEELETTNEELQSLNEELETTNQELEERTKELDQVNSVYAQTLEKIRLPVMLVNQERRIEFWNQMALKLFGFKSKPPVDLTVDQLPLSETMRNTLVRRHRAVLMKDQPMVARGQDLGPRFASFADIHFSVISREDRTRNVLIMFEPQPADGSSARKAAKQKKY